MSTFAHLNHAVWGEIAPELTPKDFNEPEQMDVDFLRLLSRMRRDRDCGVPFRVVSDARDPEGSVGSTQSAHKERPCKAVDLRALNNAERWKIVTTALAHGIRRIGIYPPTPGQIAQFGKGSGSVHVDASTVNAQDRIWMSW
jgi:hypothetical protein